MPVVINSKFKPFSYAEMLQPVMMATQAHQALEDSYSELDTKASMWEKLADSAIDKDVYQQYKAYADSLRAQSDRLAQEGLTPSARRNMLDMRSRYAQEITPIEEAYAERQRQARVQQEMMLKDPTHMYRTNANEVGLRQFMNNPNYDAISDNYSGALLTKQASDIASNLKAALTDKTKLKSLGLPYQYERELQYGYTPEQVDAAIRGDKNASPVLMRIIDQVLQSSGITSWENYDAIKDKVRGFIGQGIYSSIGTKKNEHFTDQFSMQDALNANQHTRQVAAQVAAQKAAEERQRQERLKMYNINPTPLYGTSEVSARNKATLDELNKWRDKGYIRQDGKLTDKGWTAIKNQLLYNANGAANSNSPYVRGRAYTGRDAEFMAWASKHGVKYTMPQRGENLNSQGRTFYTYTDPVLQGYGNMTNYYNSTRSKINSGQLVTGTPNIDVYRQGIRDKTTQDYLLNRVTAALAGGNIYQVGDLSVTSKGVTMGKGEGISAAQFRELATDNPILYVINSPTTNNQLIELSDGTKYIMPKGIMDNINQADISDVNTKLANSGSLQESAVLLNQANSYLGTLLNYNEGTGVSTNDGTITL